MKWFRHDASANRDDKLGKVLLKYGSDGYALYWLCLELIADRMDKDHADFELRHDAELLGSILKVDSQRVEEIMKLFITLRLFENDGGIITCMKLAQRMDISIVRNPQIKALIKNAPNCRGLSATNGDKPGYITLHYTTLDENKEEYKRPAGADRVSKTFKKPTTEEVKAYCLERRNGIDAEAFMAHYESNGWRVGKSPMKNWRMAIVTWEKQAGNFKSATKPVEVAIAERASVPPPPSNCVCGEPLVRTNTRAMCRVCGNTWDLAGNEWRLS